MDVAAKLRQWQRDWAAARSLERLGAGERDALARDLGLPGDTLDRIVPRGPGARAGYGAFIPPCRGSAFGLPMAWAASFDIMVTEALRHQAGFCTKLAECA